MIEFKYIKSKFIQVLILSFLLALVLFLPITLIDAMNGDAFHYAGDYNCQQIPFWQYANAYIKEGGSFSWETELGSGFINAYAFSPLGSLFFWITLILPSSIIPWVMVPMFCCKFALAGAGGYLWGKRWVRDFKYAMLIGVLYAFCGYNIYSIFYNSFLDVTCLFPYLLWALDKNIMEHESGCLAFFVALNLFTNYYFFIGECIFLVIYFSCMSLGKKYVLTFSTVMRAAFESILGVAMGCVLLIPAILYLMQNPRTGEFLNDYGFLSYGAPQKYMAILCSLFLMPEPPYSNALFPNAATQWQNVCAYLPVVGIIGGIALNRVNRNHPFSRMLRFSLLAAFIPALNALFTLENANYYARWFYMPILILCGATGYVFDNDDICVAYWKDSWKTVFLFTLGFVSLGLLPSTVALFGTKIGITTSGRVFWPIWIISITGVVVGGIVVKKCYNRESFASSMLCVILVFSFVYGETHMLFTRYMADATEETSWYDGYKNIDEVKKILPEGKFYRIDTTGLNNYGLLLGKSSETFFSSTVAPGTFSFYKAMGINRSVRSLVAQDYYALRSLLSTRYLLVDTTDDATWSASVPDSEIKINSENANSIVDILSQNEKESVGNIENYEWAQNWIRYGDVNNFVVYENENWVPMGFTFDYYITESEYATIETADAPNALLRALVLTDEQIAKYGSIFEHLPEEKLDDCDYNTFVKDCADRRKQTADAFEPNNYGFTATTSFDSDELVFFSVPYEENAFTATVNGEPAEVEEVDCGLMAIYVPAGKADIVVTYHTPGFSLGIKITVTAVLIWIGYMTYTIYNQKRKKALLLDATAKEKADEQ